MSFVQMVKLVGILKRTNYETPNSLNFINWRALFKVTSTQYSLVKLFHGTEFNTIVPQANIWDTG